MPDELELVNLEVMPPRLVPPDQERGEQQQLIDIEITLRNNSAAKTYHAISDLRSLNYDPANQTLLVGLSEPEASPEMTLTHISSPSQIALDPGESGIIKVSVPMVIKLVYPSDTPALNVERLDISNLRHVTCRFSYNETPYYPEPSASAKERMKHLHSWGRTVERKVDARVPSTKSRKKK